MKQTFILILFSLCICLSSFGQEKTRSLGSGSMGEMGLKRGGENNEMDSLGYNNIESLIQTWKLSDYGTSKSTFHVDTLMGDIQNFNPIYRRSISNSYLGNLGSPYQSNIFKDRVRDESFMFFNTFEAYMNMPDEVLFFNTTTPFTSFFYETAGSKDRAENLLRILHSQNINPYWNVGINFNLISSEGQYQNQKTKLYDFNFFSSYEKGRYGAHFVLSQNRIEVNENGGIEDDGLISDSGDEPENIQVKLNDTKNKLSNFNISANQYYNLGAAKQSIVKGDTTDVYPVKFVHDLNYESNSREFKEGTVNAEFFKHNYLSNLKSADETKLNGISNGLHFVFNENQNKKLSFGARVGILNEFSKYNLRRQVGENLYSQRDKNIHNTQLMTSIFRQTGKSWNWKFSGAYVFEGYRQKDFQLDGNLTYSFGDSLHNHSLAIKSQIKSRTPDFLMTEYNGNHQKWANDFDRSKEITLGLEYRLDKYGFKIGGQVDRIDNYTYFGLDALPSQESKSIEVATAYIEKNFSIGKFKLNQKIIGQQSSNDKVLPLPSLAISSSNYYQNSFFNGALDIQAGFTAYYNTSFYAPNYMPSTGQFFLQEDKKIGDYPKVDLFFNFRIKRTRIFVMYEHFNARMGSTNYFSTLHYPINPGMLKYGLRWTFYD